MLPKKNGILVASEAILTSLFWSNFGLFFICCSFDHVLHKNQELLFVQFFGGLLGILTRLISDFLFFFSSFFPE
jgi:hypothetical protein